MISLLQAALNDPIELSKLLQQQKKLQAIMNDIPARQWLYEKACQSDDLNQAKRVQDIIIRIMISSRLIWCGKDISHDVYSEALSRTWEWFMNNLQQYDSAQSSFVTWFNQKLKWNILDVIRKKSREPHQIDDEKPELPSLPPDLWSETIQEWLDLVNSNPNLLNCRMQNHPHVNCRVLLIDILNLLEDTGDFCWDDLTQRYSVKPSAVRKFCKERCFRIFKQFLSE